MVGSGTAQSSRCEPSRHQPDHLGRNLTPLGRSRGLGPPAGLIARTAFATPLRSGISRRPIVSRVPPQRRREVITNARLLYRGACGTGGPRDPHQRRPALSQVFPLGQPDCPDGFEPTRSDIAVEARRAMSVSESSLDSRRRNEAGPPAPLLRSSRFPRMPTASLRSTATSLAKAFASCSTRSPPSHTELCWTEVLHDLAGTAPTSGNDGRDVRALSTWR